MTPINSILIKSQISSLPKIGELEESLLAE